MSITTLRPLPPVEALHRQGITPQALWERWQTEWAGTEQIDGREQRVWTVVLRILRDYPREYRGKLFHTVGALQVLRKALIPLGERWLCVRVEACVAAARHLQYNVAKAATAVAIFGSRTFAENRRETIRLWQLFLRRAHWEFDAVRFLVSYISKTPVYKISKANLVTYAIWKGRRERLLHVSQWPKKEKNNLQDLLCSCVRTGWWKPGLAQVIARVSGRVPEGFWQWRGSFITVHGTHVCATRLLQDFARSRPPIEKWLHSWQEYRRREPRGFAATDPWHRVLRLLVPNAEVLERVLSSLLSSEERGEFLFDLACSHFKGKRAMQFPSELFAFEQGYRGRVRKLLVEQDVPDLCASSVAEFVRMPQVAAIVRRVHFEAAARAAIFRQRDRDVALSWLSQLRPMLLGEEDFSGWLQELWGRREVQLLRLREDGQPARMPDYCSVDASLRARCALSYMGTLGMVTRASYGVVGLILEDAQLFEGEKLAHAERWIVASHQRFARNDLPDYVQRHWLYTWQGAQPPFGDHPLWPQLKKRISAGLPPVSASLPWMGVTWEEWQRGEVIHS